MNPVPDTPQKSLRDISVKYGASMLFMIFSYVVLGIVLNIIFSIIIQLVTGKTGLDTSTDAGYAFYLFINSFVSYVPLFLMFGILFRRDIAETAYLTPYPKTGGELIILFLAGGCLARTGALITSFISTALNDLFDVPRPEMAFADSISQSTAQFIIFEIFGVIVAPICEELLYRHLLLRPMRKYGDMAAAVISSLMFGLGHFNFDQFLYTFLFGFTLAVVAIRRNSVVPAVILHMINNIMAGFSSYLPETFGNELADAIFAELAESMVLFGWIMLFGGAVAVVIAVIKHLFVFRQPDQMTDAGEFRVIFTTPVVLIGIAASLVLTFVMLYK